MQNIQQFEGRPAGTLPSWSHPFWNGEGSRGADWSNSPAWRDRILLAVGLWTMLGLVALAVVVSRYLLPVLLVASVALAATLRLMGLV